MKGHFYQVIYVEVRKGLRTDKGNQKFTKFLHRSWLDVRAVYGQEAIVKNCVPADDHA